MSTQPIEPPATGSRAPQSSSLSPQPSFSYLTHLEFTYCGARLAADELRTVCPECGKVLYPRYELAAAGRAMTHEALAARPFDLWRYHEVLPVRDPANAVSLGEGGTP